MTLALANPPESLIEHALSYAHQGLEVFPVDPRSKAPLHTQLDATTDEIQVAAWWRRWGHALIGCRVPEDVVILDVDARHGGLATWKALREVHGEVPTTRTHFSGRGDNGGHLWFRRPPGKLSIKPLNIWARDRGTGHATDKGGWSAGVDLLVHRHRYSILPPSPHPATKRPYWWANGRGLEREPAVMPAWLAKLITEPPVPVLDPRPIRREEVDSIADWFSETFSWNRLLGEEGWTLIKADGESDGSAWRHPAATAEQSASIKHGCLFVYSTNTDFEPTTEGEPHGYTRFRAYAVLSHGGDMSAAAREVRSWRMSGDGNYELPATLTSGVGSDHPRVEVAEYAEDRLEPVCWADLFSREHKGESWLLRPVVAEGRQAAVWAVHKTGKSLFSLDVAVRTALGRPYTADDKSEPVNVIYLDMEMTEDDLQERMDDYGYGPDDAVALQERLHYYLLPNLPPLDTAAGAAVLCDLVARHEARLVVIDTMARIVAGEENSADTYRDFYRHSGAALKRRGVSLLRLDHAGKDPTKGQRGSSSKGDDVDVIYELKRTDTGYTLITTAARMGWVPQKSSFALSQEPFLALTWTGKNEGWPAGTAELADALDNLAGGAELSRREAEKLLRVNKYQARSTTIAAALRWRSERSSELPQKVSE